PATGSRGVGIDIVIRRSRIDFTIHSPIRRMPIVSTTAIAHASTEPKASAEKTMVVANPIAITEPGLDPGPGRSLYRSILEAGLEFGVQALFIASTPNSSLQSRDLVRR